MVGFGANRRGGRLPSFILIALLVVIGILSFNYWTVSSKHARLQEELIELQAQVTRTETARSRLEKRNSELMLQADNHKREVLKKEDEHTDLGNQLKAKDNQHKKCEEEKIRVQNNVSGRLAEIQQLQEQLAELRQEFLRQEDQIHEYKKNCTFLEKKLEYESLQCGQQISELKEQYEEKLKLVEQGFQDGKQKQNVQESLPNASHELPGGKAKAKRESVLETIERDMKVMEKNDAQNKDIKKGKDAEQVKLVRDAGMPGIEDNEIGKVEDVPVALKKPIITPRKNGEQVEQLHFITAKALIPPQENKSDHSFGKEHKPHPPLQDKSMLKPLNHQEVQALDSVDKTPIRFEEQQKRSQEGNPDEKPRRLANEPVIQIPANAMQNDPVQHLEKALEPGFEDLPQRHGAGAADLHQLKQNRFFEENESPVDPHRGSKLADYNGDDGNMGEYEADKQAELVYNEEEDGDGGEEDVQDDEERELPGDNLGDYGKQHAANDVL